MELSFSCISNGNIVLPEILNCCYLQHLVILTQTLFSLLSWYRWYNGLFSYCTCLHHLACYSFSSCSLSFFRGRSASGGWWDGPCHEKWPSRHQLPCCVQLMDLLLVQRWPTASGPSFVMSPRSVDAQQHAVQTRGHGMEPFSYCLKEGSNLQTMFNIYMILK